MTSLIIACNVYMFGFFCNSFKWLLHGCPETWFENWSLSAFPKRISSQADLFAGFGKAEQPLHCLLQANELIQCYFCRVLAEVLVCFFSGQTFTSYRPEGWENHLLSAESLFTVWHGMRRMNRATHVGCEGERMAVLPSHPASLCQPAIDSDNFVIFHIMPCSTLGSLPCAKSISLFPRNMPFLPLASTGSFY